MNKPIYQSIVFSILILFFFSCNSDNKTGSIPRSDSLEEGFMDPPVSARPRAYLDWTNGNFDLDRITYDLEEAKEKGMGGFDIWDVGTSVDPAGVVPDGPPFMGEKSLQAIAHTVREANRLGLELGLVISSSWNAGGHWVKPEHGVMGLFRTSTSVSGPDKINIQLPFPELPERYGSRRKTLIDYGPDGLPTFYREVAVLAIPFSTDSIIPNENNIIILSDKMSEDGSLIWDVPEGKWIITRYVCAPTGQPLMLPSPNSVGRMIDHFSEEATRVHMNFFFERLEKELGTLKDQSLTYLYTDSYEANSAAWTPVMKQEFEQKRGYDLTKYLPVLDGFIVRDVEYTDRFLFDFTKTLSDLIIENHYRQATELCAENGLGFAAEAGGPGAPIHNVPFEDLKALGSLTIPRGEFWNKHPQLEKLQIVKNIASASHIYNQKFVEAESFTSVWLWQEGPSELKPLADRAMAEGLNRFIYHTFPHVPLEAGTPGWVYNFGTLIYPERIWWEKSKPFHLYIARSCFMLQQGNFVGDVAYYYGDKAPNFVPPKKIPESLGWGYDYDAINSEVILKYLDVKDGLWTLPHGQTYALLVLPDEKAFNPEVLSRLAGLVKKGGVLLGSPPSRSYSLNNWEINDKKVKDLAEELWGGFSGKESGINEVGNGKVAWNLSEKEVLKEMGVLPDVIIESASHPPNLDFIHRQTPEADIYFIRNIDSLEITMSAGFRHINYPPEFWDPVTGNIVPPSTFGISGSHTFLPLTLGPQESIFLTFRKNSSNRNEALTYDQMKEVFDEKIISTVIHGRLVKRDLESQEIPGPWKLTFAPGQMAPAFVVSETLKSWTEFEDEGIRHYSGKVTYENSFNWNTDKNDLHYLSLGDFKEVCEVFLNGHNLGVVWHPSQKLDITPYLKNGSNHLVIEVMNNYNNALIADAKRPEKFRKYKSNITKLPNAWNQPMAEASLQRSGLFGPVSVSGYSVVR